MTTKPLTAKVTAELKARAHHLHPVVMIGKNGLTEAVTAETDSNLDAHELIKVRISGDDRSERRQTAEALAAATGAQLVAVSGKLAVLFRPKEVENSK